MSLENQTKETESPFLFHTQAIEKLVAILEQSGLTEIDYRQGDVSIRVSRTLTVAQDPTLVHHHVGAPVSHSPAFHSPPPAPQHQGESVTSPMVGTVYLSPKPGAEPFVKVGDRIQEGQVLLIIEAMKVMNPIKAPKSGTVSFIKVGNGVPVEYGEELLWIE